MAVQPQKRTSYKHFPRGEKFLTTSISSQKPSPSWRPKHPIQATRGRSSREGGVSQCNHLLVSSPPLIYIYLSLSSILAEETPVNRNRTLVENYLMEWWDQVRRVYNGVALRFKIRKRGLVKLQHDVRACGYEDVRVMWEMLQRNETENARFSGKSKKMAFWNCFGWARCTPYIGRSF